MAQDDLWIETGEALSALCTRLSAAQWLALDTEFMREHTYYPQLCLVQLATPELVACVDVLAIPALDALLALLQNPGITKVFHSARQDLEMFFHLTGRVPAPLFDTQLAASFAGFPDQAGYATVVQGLLGVSLGKAHTRADWTRRPLPEAVREYAADDVRYLREIYPLLRSKLDAQGRLDWLAAENAKLTDELLYRPDPVHAWQRLRGLQRLRPRQFAAGQALAAWRERRAMEDNLPRQWVLKDEALMDLAKQRPATLEALHGVRGLQESAIRKHGEELLNVIKTAEPGVRTPAHEVKLTARQDAAVEALLALAHLKAAESDISAARLTTRAELELLLGGRRDLKILEGWRLETAGRALLEFLEGKTALAVSRRALEIQARK